MPETYAFILAVLLIATTILLHFLVLQWLSWWQERWRGPAHSKIVLIICGLILAHMAETAIFAGGYWLGERAQLGSFVSLRPMSHLHLFYFSLEAFTTQGLGDIYPVGALRLIASLEPLAGLILIGWSTSFTFLTMSREWRDNPRD
ncbi:ion channel [Phenylobacterium sp.]|uniref:ion channel n=1 Tax=Phenylobacterium sp. TaxID=1871053 RepID=UPI00273646E9|nr:ion channel [Phenylobacterium sp.]MDP3660610.1 ion channel [Phenylobacterium sp.]